jgi:hypothetical protein
MNWDDLTKLHVEKQYKKVKTNSPILLKHKIYMGDPKSENNHIYFIGIIIVSILVHGEFALWNTDYLVCNQFLVRAFFVLVLKYII